MRVRVCIGMWVYVHSICIGGEGACSGSSALSVLLLSLLAPCARLEQHKQTLRNSQGSVRTCVREYE